MDSGSLVECRWSMTFQAKAADRDSTVGWVLDRFTVGYVHGQE